MQRKRQYRGKRFGWAGWDGLGVLASSLCLVHCLALPWLLAAAALFSLTVPQGSLACCILERDFWIHVALLGLVVPVGLVALLSGQRRHRNWSIVALGLAGVCLMVTALLWGHQWLGGQGERVLTVSGSLALVGAHLWNRQQCADCDRGHEEPRNTRTPRKGP